MDRRWMRGAIVVIVVALVGLMALQAWWINGILQARTQQLKETVGNALLAISDRLEREERWEVLRSNASGQRLMLRLDTLRGQQPAELRSPIQAEEDINELVGDLVRDILRAETGQDIRARLRPALLDSLIGAAFAAQGLARPIAYGVFSKDGVRIPLETDVPGLDTALVRSPYRVRLFRHDLVDNGTDLHVLLSDEHASPWYGIGLQLSIAALFIALIVAVFVAALRIIVRQKRISDIRNDLVNNLTHELKTPISTIGLACEAIVDPSIPRTEEQVRSYVGMIRDENKRLGALVENVLQSAVLDSGHMMLKVVELDMHALIHDVIRSSTILVSRRSGRIVTELAAEIHHVQGDRIHLTNLLYNLIDNAVKYTRSEPEIRISTRSNATHLTISVTDNGIGIAPSEQRKIFDRLYRVPTGNIHNAKGFGLGLSYVRTVVERHHGRITLNSTPGQGSTFHIQLPFEHVVTREAASR
ncbi:MAG: HAMP domain-containing histidine kinase [Flavobacteriales bacterium]|jgi:two-component system phosphate regulon sensor histidine kinase PhoR|nr:HAMP domain-containing histidine kinase [Flavobacteriales bacterium]